MNDRLIFGSRNLILATADVLNRGRNWARLNRENQQWRTWMSDVTLSPIQWSGLLNSDDVRPIDVSDAACLSDIRDVLDKHGCLDRFGVSLLHRHFPVDDDEIMLETTDIAKREHWVRPVRRASLQDAGVEAQTTMVCFDSVGYTQVCVCSRDNNGHTGGHASTL
jgi:hypothetical protein